MILVPPLGKEIPPTQCYLIIGPALHDIRSSPDDDVEMITQQCKGKNLNAEDPRQFLQPVTNPFFAMRVIFSRSLFAAAQMRPTNTPIDLGRIKAINENALVA
jgi:hypothetical protein